jgi:hypothetical protein
MTNPTKPLRSGAAGVVLPPSPARPVRPLAGLPDPARFLADYRLPSALFGDDQRATPRRGGA